MKVDRERFLVLVAALATGVVAACETSPAAPPPNDPVSAPRPVAEPLVVPPIASPAPVAYTAAPSEPPPEPPSPPPVAPRAPNPYDGTPVKGQSCEPALNRVGTVPACTIRPPGPTCESIADTKKECTQLGALLKPRVAQAAVECLQTRSGTKAICEFNVSSICAYEALASACIEPSAKLACDGVMKSCGGGGKMSRDSCEAGISGIADAKRKKFISCITEFCRFETCLTYL